MRYLKVLVIVFALMALAPQTAFGNSTSFKYGEIIEVFPEQHKVRVVIGGQMDIFVLDSSAQIYRNSIPTSLVSARPIAEGCFQDGLFFFNDQGRVVLMLVNYTIDEIQDQSGAYLIYYDIFGTVKDMEQSPTVIEGSADL